MFQVAWHAPSIVFSPYVQEITQYRNFTEHPDKDVRLAFMIFRYFLRFGFSIQASSAFCNELVANDVRAKAFMIATNVATTKNCMYGKKKAIKCVSVCVSGKESQRSTRECTVKERQEFGSSLFLLSLSLALLLLLLLSRSRCCCCLGSIISYLKPCFI